MDYKYQGIILSKFDIAEVDRLYNIYTLEVGKIRILGKGVRNPNAKLAGNLEPVTLGEIFIAKTRGRGKITGAIAVNSFLHIKSDFEATRQVFYIFGILDKMMAEEERDERIFHLLLEYLKSLENIISAQKAREEKINILTLGFLFKFLDFMGYKIDVEKCMNCHKKLKDEANYFSAEQGGFLCMTCRRGHSKGIKSTGGAIKLIRIWLKNDIKNFAKISAPKADIMNTKTISGEMVKWIV